jgi:hypothetical protein
MELGLDSPSTLKDLEKKLSSSPDMAKLVAMLPFFRLKGKPYTLQDHYFFRPMFRLDLPRRCIYKCGRQVGKSSNMSASKLVKTLCIPHFNVLFVCPRFEQIKRISNDNIRALIRSSPVQNLFVQSAGKDQNVLQRTFRNGSTHYYSFAFMDADRVRGLAVNELELDEIQDIRWEFVPIIAQTLAGSPRWKNQLYTGTPKTLDNTIEHLWRDSSMGEWATKCAVCGHWNIACSEHDLMGMIGKEGLQCAKCCKGLNPRTGGWIFPFPERNADFVGYHVPQPIHPYHCEYPKNWQDLLHNQKRYPVSKFFNECLGESYDSAAKLMTLKDLRRISTGKTNTLKEALQLFRGYQLRTLGIDWGGGGDESESYTAIALAGVRPAHDLVEILYATKLHKGLDPAQETQLILDLVTKFQPEFIAHDYGGAGNVREIMMIQAGVPAARVVPYTYSVTAHKEVIFYKPPVHGSRKTYMIDKPRSLVTLCSMMRAGKIKLPAWSEKAEDNMFLDFLNLGQEVQERPRGSDVVLVTKVPDSCDDICHAVNYAASCIWYSQGRYPDLAEALQIKLSDKDISSIAPRLPEWQ